MGLVGEGVTATCVGIDGVTGAGGDACQRFGDLGKVLRGGGARRTDGCGRVVRRGRSGRGVRTGLPTIAG